MAKKVALTSSKQEIIETLSKLEQNRNGKQYLAMDIQSN